MAGISATQVVTELGAYIRANNKEVKSWFYKAGSPLFQYCRTITKIKGKYPSFHSITDHVVQAFASTWNEIGTTHFKVNELTAHHIKVNYPIIPSDIEASWLGELNEEDLALADKSISRYIMERELKPKVMEDICDLVVNGDIDSGDDYLESMDGIIQVIANGLANTDNPMYKVLLSATITDSNIVDLITEYVKKLPKKARRNIKAIFMSTTNLDRYRERYEAQFGTSNLISLAATTKDRIAGIPLVGIDELEGSNLIFSTIDGNMVKLVDTFTDPPQITDIQTLDYKVKIFMEGHLGINFLINQAVFVAQFSGSDSGLASASQNELYYIN